MDRTNAYLHAISSRTHTHTYFHESERATLSTHLSTSPHLPCCPPCFLWCVLADEAEAGVCGGEGVRCLALSLSLTRTHQHVCVFISWTDGCMYQQRRSDGVRDWFHPYAVVVCPMQSVSTFRISGNGLFSKAGTTQPQPDTQAIRQTDRQMRRNVSALSYLSVCALFVRGTLHMHTRHPLHVGALDVCVCVDTDRHLPMDRRLSCYQVHLER
mmetsp:Transcript_25163/g.62313  ORF Transcript_25163/g.62313 Transcript_25163/m.62313 type:complete len:213 (-) Transcript_25163:565-1203(-)